MSEMALSAKLGYRDAGFTAGMKAAEVAVSSLHKALKKQESQMAGFTKSIENIGSVALNTASSFISLKEKGSKAFTTILGDAQKAKESMDSMRENIVRGTLISLEAFNSLIQGIEYGTEGMAVLMEVIKSTFVFSAESIRFAWGNAIAEMTGSSFPALNAGISALVSSTQLLPGIFQSATSSTISAFQGMIVVTNNLATAIAKVAPVQDKWVSKTGTMAKSLEPLISSGLSTNSMYVNTASNIGKVIQSVAKDTSAKKVQAKATTAVGLASRGAAVGVKALGTSVKSALGVIGIVIEIIGIVVDAVGLMEKSFDNAGSGADEFGSQLQELADNSENLSAVMSETVRESLNEFSKMSDGVENSMVKLNIGLGYEDGRDAFVNNVKSMGESAVSILNDTRANVETKLLGMFANYKTFSTETQIEILTKFREGENNKVIAVQTAQNKIIGIYEKAQNEQRDLNTAELADIESHLTTIRNATLSQVTETNAAVLLVEKEMADGKRLMNTKATEEVLGLYRQEKENRIGIAQKAAAEEMSTIEWLNKQGYLTAEQYNQMSSASVNRLAGEKRKAIVEEQKGAFKIAEAQQKVIDEYFKTHRALMDLEDIRVENGNLTDKEALEYENLNSKLQELRPKYQEASSAQKILTDAFRELPPEIQALLPEFEKFGVTSGNMWKNLGDGAVENSVKMVTATNEGMVDLQTILDQGMATGSLIMDERGNELMASLGIALDNGKVLPQEEIDELMGYINRSVIAGKDKAALEAGNIPPSMAQAIADEKDIPNAEARNLMNSINDEVDKGSLQLTDAGTGAVMKIFEGLLAGEPLTTAGMETIMGALKEAGMTEAPEVGGEIGQLTGETLDSKLLETEAGTGLSPKVAENILSNADAIDAAVNTLNERVTTDIGNMDIETASIQKGTEVPPGFGTGVSNNLAAATPNIGIANLILSMFSPAISAAQTSGGNTSTGFGTGVSNNSSAAVEKVKTLGNDSVNQLKGLDAKSRPYGLDLSKGFGSGVDNGKSDAKSKAKSVADDSVTAMSVDASGSGGNVGSTFVSGVSGYHGAAWNAGYDLGLAAKNGAEAALGIASPSREFKEIANQTNAGFINQMKRNLGSVKEAGFAVGSAVIEGFKKSDNLADMVSDFDFKNARIDVQKNITDSLNRDINSFHKTDMSFKQDVNVNIAPGNISLDGNVIAEVVFERLYGLFAERQFIERRGV